MNNPLVSVVIATFNRAELLKKAIKSIFNQTYESMELIIVNDGSTDTTQSNLLEFARGNKRITVVTNSVNLGFVKSLNKGVAQAKGKYIARLDDDDYWLDPDKIKKQVGFLESRPEYVLVGGGATWHDPSGNELFRYLLPQDDREIRKKILVDNCFVHSSVVFRKKDWERIGGYKEVGMACDWELWLALGAAGKFYNFQEYFVHYLKWSGNMSNFNVRKNLKMQMDFQKRYGAYYPGYAKALILSLILYAHSFFLFKRELKSFFLRMRVLFFGKPPYANGK